MQAEALVDPGRENFRSVGHDLQEFPSLYWLAGHDLQELPSLIWWAGHWQAEALVDLGEEVAPVGHDLQEFPSMYLLAGHPQPETSHSPMPGIVANPVGHNLHSLIVRSM